MEDDNELREALERALVRARPDLDIKTARNGQHGLALAKIAFSELRAFALVITDHRMGIMTGAELLDALAREQLTHAGILLSGTDSAAAQLRELGSGAAFLRKPFKFDDLLGLIDGAIGP